MRTFDVVVAIFAAFMLVRHVPRALSLLRGQGQQRAMAVVSLVNVALAVALLVFAFKGILGRLTFH
jgi:hypothetical protein